LSVNIDDLYKLGLWMQRFRDSAFVLPKVKGESNLVYGLQTAKGTLEELEIGEDCTAEISEWIKRLNSNYDDKSQIKKEDAAKLTHDSDRWNERFHRDLGRKLVLETKLESGLNPEELLKMANSQPSGFIREEVWNRLTEIEKSDFSDAARCLLLGAATPSVMVGLRGAEASVRNYYRCKTKMEPRDKTWRQLTNELKSEAAKLDVKDAFIGYLDYVGETKRNFAQHPNSVYSLKQAVIIFMQVVSLIEDIYTEIR